MCRDRVPYSFCAISHALFQFRVKLFPVMPRFGSYLLAGLAASLAWPGPSLAQAQGEPNPIALCEYNKFPNPPARQIRNTVNKLRAGMPVTIVAIGTSSTEGVGASSPKAAFPAVLQDLLKQAFPASSVTVINKGQGGQVNQQLVVRLEQEVLALKPDLVIWQTGTNDAINRTDLAAFKRSVTFALTTLRERGIEVILMDGQFFPEAAQNERYRRYQEALAEIADAAGVPLVPRYTIMKHLVTELRLPFTRLLAEDHFHPSDFTYACMASYVKGLLQAMP